MPPLNLTTVKVLAKLARVRLSLLSLTELVSWSIPGVNLLSKTLIYCKFPSLILEGQLAYLYGQYISKRLRQQLDVVVDPTTGRQKTHGHLSTMFAQHVASRAACLAAAGTRRGRRSV